MKRNVILNAFAVACTFLPTAFLHAEDKAEPAIIRLTHNVLRYNQTKEESKPDGGATDKVESSGLTTFPEGIEIGVFVNGYSVYAYPVTQGGTLWFGKAIGSNMEAGISLSLNSHDVKDGDEYSSRNIGGYFFYTRPLTSAINFETDINPSLKMGSAKSISGTTTTKADMSGYTLYLDLLAVVPIVKNFDYVFGIDYTMDKYDVKSKSTGTSTTTKNNNSELGIILAKFRYYI